MKMLKFKELLLIKETNEYVFYVTNNEDYPGIKRVAKENKEKFEYVVKEERLTPERWNAMEDGMLWKIK